MVSKDKKKPTAFRITEETSEKFKEIAQDMGANQQQALAKLIEVYEIEKGKESFPEMRESIDTFDGYVRAASNMYLQALESVQNMRALVRTEYDAQLKSKDLSIVDLQERIALAEKIAEEASEKESEYQRQIKEVNEKIKNLEESSLKEREDFKEKLNESQKAYVDISNSYAKLQLTEAETKSVLSGFMKENQELKSEINKLIEENQTFNGKLQEYIRRNENLLFNIEREKQRADEEIKRHEDKFSDYKRNIQIEYQLEIQLKINELQNSHKIELDEIRKEMDKYKDLYYKSINP